MLLVAVTLAHGISRSIPADRTGNLPFRTSLRYQQYRRISAIVHGLALLKQKNLNMPIYSDSRNALSWVKQRKCKTKLERTEKTEALFQLIERAEKWLKENTYTTPLLKWETDVWGEVPADFGRK